MKRLLVILLLVGWTTSAFAQAPADFDVKKNNKQLDVIEKALNTGNITSETISINLKTINSIQNEINQAKTLYGERLASVQKKIGALGAVPENDAKEPAEIAANRKQFAAEEEKIKSKLAQLELMNAKIDEINALTLKVRNQSLLNKIMVRQSSIMQIKEFGQSLWSFFIFVYDIIKSPYSWYGSLSSEQKQTLKDNSALTAAVICFALIVSVYLSIIIRRRFGYRDCASNPTLAQKLESAAAMAVSFGVIPSLTLGALLLWLRDSEIINTGNLGRLLYLSALYLLYFSLAYAAVRVIFVPNCGNWRIANLSDSKAKSVSRALIYSAAAITAVSCLQRFAVETNAHADSLYALQFLSIWIKAAAILFVSRRMLYIPVNEKIPDATAEEDAELGFAAKGSAFATLVSVGIVAMSLFGYLRLSEFIADRLILSALVISGFWLFDKVVRILLHKLLLMPFWRKSLHVSARFLVKTEFWAGILLTPLLWFAGIISLLGIWGFSVDIMLHDIKTFLLGFNIGGMHISIVSLLLGIVGFFVSMFIFKTLKRSVISGNLSKIDMEEDSRNSLAAGIGLIGFIISLMVAFAVMGGSLSSIAIVAGALSFGVGLGMQNIVSNFVSGIIILFERPIKIGDWVIINGQEGIVKTISMRATLLESFNKSDVIIPNSAILSGSLVNMTYSNRIGRIEIKFGIPYGNDVQFVEGKLVEIAVSTAGVLSNPPPSVAFTDFADNRLSFQLNCYTANVYARQSIANQLRESIIKTFAGSGILPALKKNVPEGQVPNAGN